MKSLTLQIINFAVLIFKHKIMKKDKEHDYDISALGDASDLLIENSEENSTDNYADGFSEEEEMKEMEVKEDEKQGEGENEIEAKEEKEASQKTGQEEQEKEQDPEKMKSMAIRLLNAAHSLFNGDFSEEEILPLLDACEAKKRIAEAYKAGEIAGRNSQIEEKLAAPEEIVPDLVGTPNLNRRPEASIFDIARMARF